MQRSEIIAAIDQELATLQRVRELLQSSGSSSSLKALTAKAKKAIAKPGRKRRVMSEEARLRIGLAQKRRWAKQRKADAATGEK